MFDKKYKAINDRMRPSDEAVKSTLNSIKGSDTEASEKRNYVSGRKKWIIGIASVLCVCFMLPIAVVTVSKISLERSMSKPWAFNYYSASENEDGSVENSKDEYDKIYKKIEASVPRITWNSLTRGLAESMFGGAMEKADVANDASPATPVEAPNPSSADFSETNTQVEGVDEADVVKTDGEYIYALSSESVSIIRADKGDSTVVSTIFANELEKHSKTARISFTSMYLFGDKLIVLANERTEVDGSYIVDVSGYSSFLTVVYVCDISDRGNIKFDAVLCQDGSYSDSRMIGDKLVLISNHWIYGNIDMNRPETYVPCTYDNNGEGHITAPNDVYIMPEINMSAEYYTYVTELDINNPEEFTSELAILGNVGTIYCSEENLVLTRTQYSTEKREITYTTEEDGDPVITNGKGKKAVLQSGESKTELFLIPLKGEELVVSAHESVSGRLLNQFSIDEFNGNFRLVVTKDINSIIVEEYQNGENEMQYAMPLESDTSNALYVLDSKLNTIGSIDDIAPKERVYSVRFMGEVGYFVTFRETDPLFSVDLSDPNNPVILGELKIPGFSEYLHPWGENMLLGFGKAADESNGAVDGLKLSMFDVSDPADVDEVSCTELGEYMYSAVSSNHKAILVSFEKNLIGFPAEENYLIYSYHEDEGFIKEAEIKTGANNWYYFTELRGLYIGDCIYIVDLENCNLTIIDMSNFTLAGNFDY